MGITTVYGPMARYISSLYPTLRFLLLTYISRSVADVKRACELFFGRPSSTPSVNLPPVKYRTDLDFNRPLRIGYFKTGAHRQTQI
jgi:hypothetical protein